MDQLQRERQCELSVSCHKERASSLITLRCHLQTVTMHEVERLRGVFAVDDARNVDLARALADHFNVHVALGERLEHSPGYADHVSHSFADEGEDGHVAMDRDLGGVNNKK